ncbi:sentrin-specific protease 6 isoform X4 [Rhinatrema bivittatum]|uniref:sentrin-specific protease 6 isoform X4 n=1 Tax=Rhinatrema bivittatum TaxID=194408 RepID=UPI00112706B9|nr:sentrin-specific protease 6 isoform X4 [Rhinatrema bivittatum]
MASSRESRFLQELDRTQAKRDGGFKNNWSFDCLEESEGDAEKDEANLLTIDEYDGTDGQNEEQKPKQRRPEAIRDCLKIDCLKTYERRHKHGLKILKGNPTGLNMLATSKKLGENAQNISMSSGTVVHGRHFHHANTQISLVKTAAQRKEYPPHVQKIETDPIRLSRPKGLENVLESNEDSDLELDTEIKRKVQQKRRFDCYQSHLPLASAAIRKSHLEVSGQTDDSILCPNCGKEKKNKNKCQNCGDLQRYSRQPAALSESMGLLSRPAIHRNSTGQSSLNTGLKAKRFYGALFAKDPIDDDLESEDKQNLLMANGKVRLSVGTNVPKNARNTRHRGLRPSDLNDPIVLSSDEEEEEEDNASTGSVNRMESISPRPADSACSSPAPSSGKVEAALKENICRAEQRLIGSITTDTEPTVTIPRKARMKDQLLKEARTHEHRGRWATPRQRGRQIIYYRATFGNTVTNTPTKRRKVAPLEIPADPIHLSSSDSCESVILNCRSIRIGTLRRMVTEPVIFCLDYIKIQLEGSENSVQDIILKTFELTKCEWCSVRKLPSVFLQTIPAACHSLRLQLKMSREKNNFWYDSKSTNREEQYIILIFENGLDTHTNGIFEKIITDIGIKNDVSEFFKRISFEEANSRLVAFTKSCVENSTGASVQTDDKVKNVSSESGMKQKHTAAQMHFFDEDDEIEEPHTVFIGPIEKLIVYPPPPAKGGITVTNEDLHCLNEGEFLNDVIIDFYLKYLVLEKLRKDADRIHIFSSFFYKRLNQRERRNFQETANLSIQQRRHGRVRTWTRHVDIFQKDFIFVPLNEAAHWFLAVICFPGLERTLYEPNPHYQGNAATPAENLEAEKRGSSLSQNESDICVQSSPPKSSLKRTQCRRQLICIPETSSAIKDSETLETRRSPCTGKRAFNRMERERWAAKEAGKVESVTLKADHRTKDENGIQSKSKTLIKPNDSLNSIRISYSDDPTDGTKTHEDELIDFSEDQDSLDESSDDGGLDDDFTSELGKWHLKSTICKQPCILLMDSLRGPSRSNVVKTLREYLEIEWEVRKGSKRSFSKEFMKGSNPRVPQQNNFSDCGVYILQYVESFFENPIQSFELPMNLTNWFPQQRMKTKREEIRNLIRNLQEDQKKEKKGQKDFNTIESSLPDGTEEFISSNSE